MASPRYAWLASSALVRTRSETGVPIARCPSALRTVVEMRAPFWKTVASPPTAAEIESTNV